MLFAYLTTHLGNHALGLVSLDAMEAGREWFLLLWRNPVGTVALYGALAVHFGLALRSLYRRRHLRMPAWEATQLGLGLLIPPLLVSHIVGTRLSASWFDVTDSYTRVVLALWELRPNSGIRQAVVLLVAWTHACIGLHYWLRLKPWYPRVALVLFAGAVLLPVLALLGFAQAGREIAALARQPGWVVATQSATNNPDLSERATLDRVTSALLGGYAATLGLVLVARVARHARERQRGRIRVIYPDGREVVIPTGTTVLEASRLASIPHASVCGGRGRCSTCRVRIVRGLGSLPPPSAEEQRGLRRVGAPPNVRLACQLRPTTDIAVVPLLPASASPRDAIARPRHLAGEEREVAVLFADLRGFTQFAEHKLPYDVVFFLNRYFEAVGGAIERNGGIANQFTGDGVMALFGANAGAGEACQRALLAAGAMAQAVTELSQALIEELKIPLRMGIGIHSGPAVIGQMGYSHAMYLTAVGDTVHVASRLEALTKEYGCQLVISQEVADRAGVDASALPRLETPLRGRGTPQTIVTIDDARRMADAVRALRTMQPDAHG